MQNPTRETLDAAHSRGDAKRVIPTAEQFSDPVRRWLDSGTFVTASGLDVFVHRAGPATGIPLLFIHGFPTSSYDWRAIIEQLCGEYACTALDLPGYGLSDKPVAYSYSIFQQTDVVEAVTRADRLDTVHVVSHDVGTSVHTELLARHKEGRLSFRIASSTFLNGSILKKMARLTEFQRMLETPSELERAQQVCDGLLPHYAARLRTSMGRPDAIDEDDAAVMTELMGYQDGHRRMPNVYSYVRERYLMRDRWLDALVADDTPTQFVWGADDPVATTEMGRELSRLVARAEYTELPGVGHFTPIEAPAEIAAAIRRITSPAGTAAARAARS